MAEASLLKIATRKIFTPGLVAALVDAGCAIAFAAGLAAALTTISNGLPAASPWLAMMAMGLLSRGVAAAAAQQLFARLSGIERRDVRARVLDAVLDRRSEGESTGGRTAAIVDEVEQLDGYMVRFTPARAAAMVAPPLILAAATLASPICGLILAVALIPFVVLMVLAGGAAASAARRQLAQVGRLSGLFVDRVRQLPLILAYGAERSEVERVGHASKEVARRSMAVLKIAFISSAGLEFFAALSIALVAVYAGFSLLGVLPFRAPEALTLRTSFFVLALAPEFFAPMRRLAAAYHEKQIGQAAAERLEARLAKIQAQPVQIQLTAAPRIQFREAVITPGNGHAIGPVSFVAPAGQITALVGASGSGKTSILAFLVGEGDLLSGDVVVDGQPVGDAARLAGMAAWAGQAPLILPGTLESNMTLGMQGQDFRAVAIMASRVGLAGALERRVDGLGAHMDERGGGLSGGERRRVGLARALLKDAPVLFLDEPTADLDFASEFQMAALIRDAAKGRTVILTTHSTRVAAIADHVVML